MPVVKNTTRSHIGSGAGSSHSPRSMPGPTSRIFSTVPSPGRWRSGIHNSSTATPMMFVSRPMLSPVWIAAPCANTVHESTPTAARIMKASAIP